MDQQGAKLLICKAGAGKTFSSTKYYWKRVLVISAGSWIPLNSPNVSAIEVSNYDELERSIYFAVNLVN